jgi:hypothetical protein
MESVERAVVRTVRLGVDGRDMPDMWAARLSGPLWHAVWEGSRHTGGGMKAVTQEVAGRIKGKAWNLARDGAPNLIWSIYRRIRDAVTVQSWVIRLRLGPPRAWDRLERSS